MLLILGLLYYYQRDEHFTGYEGIDFAFSVIVVFCALMIHLFYSVLLNYRQMSDFICFGYCISLIGMSVAISGIIILTRIETED
jgi:hypothetical protein